MSEETAPEDVAARLLAAQAAATSIDIAYRLLRGLVNDPSVPEVSWESLGAEMQWAIPVSPAEDGEHLDLDMPTTLEDAGRRYRQAIEDGTSPEYALRIFVPLVLGFETGGVVISYDKEDREGGAVLLPPQKEAALEAETAAQGEEAAKRLVADWVRPVITGAPPPNHKITNPITDELEEPRGLAQAPLEGEIRGKQYRAFPFVAWAPLEIHPKAKRALFPISVRIVFDGSDHLAWTAEERETFWSHLFAWESNPADLPPLDETTESLFAYLRAKEPPSALTVREKPLPERFMLEAPTRIDRQAVQTFAALYGQKFPRSWARVRKLEELERDRVDEILSEYGEEEAMRDLRSALADSAARRPLLEERWTGKARELVLSAEERKRLRREVGRKGFREVRDDRDGKRREYLVKSVDAGGGASVEIGLSWYGTVERLVEDARKERKKELLARLDSPQSDLFSLLDDTERQQVERDLVHLGALDDAAEVWMFLARTFGVHGENPVQVEAFELYALLGCLQAENRLARIHGALRALQELRFMTRADNRSVESAFVTRVEYDARGRGQHSDGVFFVTLSTESIGVLAVFNDTRAARGGRSFEIYRFNKDLSKNDRKKLRGGEGEGGTYLKGFRLTPLHARARDLSREERALLQWVESQITTNRASTKKDRRPLQIRKGPSSTEPRVYGRDFCPLLPDGGRFYGALGNYQNTGTAKAAEAGRRLVGKPKSASREGLSGARDAGLLFEMGFPDLPKTHAKQEETLKRALNVMRRVVEVEAKGIVAVRVPHHGGDRWYGLDDAIRDLDVSVLLREALFLLFVPENWRDLLARGTEEIHAKKDAPKAGFALRITEDREVARRDAEAREKGHLVENPGDRTETPLHERLRAKAAKEKLSGPKLGEIFGVSSMTISNWTSGRKPISRDRAPLVRRWVEGGDAPSAEELLALQNRTRSANQT